MSFTSFTSPRARRRAILTSAAVVALAAAGALGEGALTGSDVARAAAVSTGDLQGSSLPSLAPLVDRVKPAVVSVKVNTVNDGSKSEKSEDAPSEIQQFLERFGGTLTAELAGRSIAELATDDSYTAPAYLLSANGLKPLD